MANAGDIQSWLAEQGLATYAEAFASNDIDLDVLPELTDADLKDLGVTSLGDRKRLLKAIASLAAANVTTGAAIAIRRLPIDADDQGRVSSPERRQVTIMFCDMVGSTALSNKLDQEEQRDVVSTFLSACAAKIRRLGGMVANYLGDGVLAYFGYPAAHEDDAERAVRAGLAILDVVGTLKPAPDVTLQARIGIASGVVVVGDLVREGVTQENAAIGETTNLAARLQALAEPHTIVISPETHGLVGALFEYRDLGRHAIKGFPKPVHVRQVLGASKLEGRFEAMHQSGTSPLLGREEELDLLMRRWEQIKRGDGCVVLLMGEPGIGKSMLARALGERVRSEPHIPLIYHCSPYHQDSALYPIISQLLCSASIERDDSAEAKIDKLEALLAQSSENLLEDMPLFAALLSIPGGERYPMPNFTPQRLRERTLDALFRQLNKLAVQQPVLMVFEDLHWVDPTSLELLSLTVDQIVDKRVLLLATARPEFSLPWPSHRHTSTISLTRLGRSEVTAVVSSLTQGKSLPSEVLDQIVARTDGVPLFIEELTKMVLESGLLREAGDRYELTGPLPPFAIPSTLHASLLARLDRLPSVKDVAQIGAVIGREFSYSLLTDVAALPERNLQSALSQLVEAGLIFQRGVPPDATYLFKHALVQDATYASLLKSRRQQLHASIARMLEERFPEVATTEPERLAHHYTEAGLAEPAVTYWRNAGELAISRSAISEAVAHLGRGLEVVAKLPDDRRRQQTEIQLRLSMGGALITTKGWTALEVQREYERARALASLIDDQPSLIRAMFVICVNRGARGNLLSAIQPAQELLQIAENHNDVQGRWFGHAYVAINSLYTMALKASKEHFEKALVLDDLEQARSVCQFVGHDVGVAILTHFSKTLALLGFPNQARLRRDELLVRGRALGHTPSLAFAYSGAFTTSWFLRDTAGMTSAADKLLGIVAEERFPHWLAYSRIWSGWLKVDEGSPQEGCRLITEGLAAVDALGTGYFHQFLLLLLANGQLKSGKIDDALDTLDRAEALNRSGQKWCEAEVHRLRGDVLVAGSADEGAESAYRKALELAHSHDAKLWEIRAAISLGRLWRDQGKRHEARDLLAPVYSWFTEGFDTLELIDAKALLNELQ
jgi:class 3 adenylate cyclase/tetratricopeptide (TPR) repeat protein